MPSMSDIQQYGMHGLPFTSGLQNGHVSSMDSTPGGQHSMDSTGWPLLPPCPFQNSGQEPLTIDGIHQRLRGLSTTASIDTNSGELDVCLFLSRARHNPSQHNTRRQEGKTCLSTAPKHSMSRKKGNRTERSNSTQPADPTRTMCQGRPNPCTRHRPSGGLVHAAALSPAPPHHSLIPCCKSNLIILHEHQSTILTYPARFRPARRWRLPQ